MVEQAILRSLPAGPGKRNERVFEFARTLKAIPALADADPKSLMPYLRRWHEMAKPVIGTQPFDETRIDFLRAWPRVKFPKGEIPLAPVLEAVSRMRPPAVADQYEGDQLRMLVSLCRELQRASGTGPFYLSSRTAGRLLDVDHTTAWRWLWLLEQDGVLAVVEKGSRQSGRATRFRYRGG
jgi:hypothetical protein